MKPGSGSDISALIASAASPEGDYISNTLNVNGAPVHVPAMRLSERLAGKAMPYAVSGGRETPTTWAEVVAFLSQGGSEITFEAETSRSAALFAEVDGGCIVVEYDARYREYTVTVAGSTREVAQQYMGGIMAMFADFPPPPPPEPDPWNIVPVDFWMQNPHTGSGYSRRRRIEVDSWTNIKQNYATGTTEKPGTRENLDALMGLDAPSGGKLILFHGPPGGGKTRAILTLMYQWKNWCGASVVTDADKMLGDATYLNSVIFDSQGQGWLLLVIEDGDEFMNVKGRDSKGQAIARLLNLGDGIVGQGIRLLTLISTNVDVAELNPAVVRPGRCMANICFDNFSPAEGTAWLAAHGVEKELDKPHSLAELYASLAVTG